MIKHENTYNEVHLEFECVGRDLRCGPDGLSDVTDGFCPSRALQAEIKEPVTWNKKQREQAWSKKC